MKIFRYIWNALFGKSKEQERFKKGGVVEEEVRKDFSQKGGIVEQEIKEDFFASNEIIEKEKKTDSEFANLPKKKSKKMNIGKKTLFEIKVHILEYGSLNTYDCKQIFKVKSLHNFISALRGQGFVFITEKMIIKDVSGQVIEKAVNYTLIDKK